MFADEEQRLIATTRALAAAVLCCVAFSWKLWLSRPLYPMTPLWSWIPAFPKPYDVAFLAGWAGLLVGVLLLPRSKLLIAGVVAALAWLFVQDQSRLWPSFYQYFFLFLCLSSYRRGAGRDDAPRILAGMRFIVAAAYFWGGVQKLNIHFFTEEFPWFIEPLTRRLPFDLPWLPAWGVAAALFEVFIGVGLLTARLRRVALLDAMLMHLGILICIGPLRDNWNNSSWIWGLTIGIVAGLLFYRAPPFRLKTMFDAPLRWSVPQVLAVALLGIAPLLNNMNCWDSALSFNVYSGNVDYAEIHLPAASVDRLPDELKAYVSPQSDWAVLSLNAWSLSEFNANPYPETRIFLAVFRRVCSYLPDDAAVLVVQEKAGWFFPKRIQRYDCPAATIP